MRTSIRTITSSTITCTSQGCGRVFANDLPDAQAKRSSAFFAPVVMHVVGKHVPHVVTTAAAAAGAYPADRPQRSRQGWRLLPTLVNAG
jgi:hypothetical protein